LEEAQERFDVDSERTSPIIIHCSAGIGRTGTIIALFNILETLMYACHPLNFGELTESQSNHKYTKENYPQVVNQILRVSVFGCVRKLREQRLLMVKEKEQYSFLYWFLQKWISTNILDQFPNLVETLKN